MKLQDTVELMNSNDFKERFKAEYYQLKIRIEGLRTMLDKYKNGTLNFTPNSSYELLFTQLIYMELYLDKLKECAKLENIEL